MHARYNGSDDRVCPCAAPSETHTNLIQDGKPFHATFPEVVLNADLVSITSDPASRELGPAVQRG